MSTYTGGPEHDQRREFVATSLQGSDDSDLRSAATATLWLDALKGRMMRMNPMSFRFLVKLAPALFLGVVSAQAQEITMRQLVGSLDQMAATAPAVDVGLLVEEVNDNVGRGVAGLPNWSLLAQLPQFGATPSCGRRRPPRLA